MLLIKYSWPICNWTFYILFIDVLDQNSVLGWHQICDAYECVLYTHLSPGNLDHGFYFLHFYLMCTVLGRCVLPKKVVLQTTFFSLCWLKFMLLFFFLIWKLIEFFHLKTLPSHLETRDDILIHKWLSGMGYLEQSSLIIIIWNIFQRDLELL